MWNCSTKKMNNDWRNVSDDISINVESRLLKHICMKTVRYTIDVRVLAFSHGMLTLHWTSLWSLYSDTSLYYWNCTFVTRSRFKWLFVNREQFGSFLFLFRSFECTIVLISVVFAPNWRYFSFILFIDGAHNLLCLRKWWNLIEELWKCWRFIQLQLTTAFWIDSAWCPWN